MLPAVQSDPAPQVACQHTDCVDMKRAHNQWVVSSGLSFCIPPGQAIVEPHMTDAVKEIEARLRTESRNARQGGFSCFNLLGLHAIQ